MQQGILGITITSILFIIGAVTKAEWALVMTIASASVVFIANIPRAIKSVNIIIKIIKHLNEHHENESRDKPV